MLISEYTGGEHLTWRQITDPTYKSDYAFADKRTNVARDAFDPVLQRVTCAAGYANDPLTKDAANCELITLNGNVFLRSTRPIRIYINHYYHHLSYSQTIYGKECAVL